MTNDIEKIKGRSSNKYAINHKTDDSGDYTIHYYTLLAVMPYGQKTICEYLENPFDALMFAMGPDMVQEIEELRAKIAELEDRITTASTGLAGKPLAG